ncbi:MAG: response regulator [Haloplanus sp.]
MSRPGLEPSPPTDGRVLVVDDEPDVAETTALMLQNRGLEAVTEMSAPAALDRLDDRIACVVSDYQMPRMDGLELFERVRDRCPDMPFVLFTGRGSEEVASEAIAAGVDHYLQKGKAEQYDRLAHCVETAVERTRAERALSKRRQQFAAIFENAFDGIFVLDLEAAVVVEANPRACELLEYPHDELVGTDIAEIHPDDVEEYLATGRELIETGDCRRVQSTCHTRSGDTIPSDITAAPMEYEGRTFLLTIMRPRRSDA